MGRGKDGYTSLLIEEEGGAAKEIVSEENGVLISTILRQYFMSLKVLGKWKYWGPSMNRKFDRVQNSLQRTHTFVEPRPSSPVAAAPRHPSIAKVKAAEGRSGAASPSDSDMSDEDEDDGADYDDSRLIQFTEHELWILRRVMTKWWRLAGLKGNPKLCDVLGAEEFQVNWTKAIAPRLEGRIREVGKAA
jgi:hypothetical protein